LILAHMCSMYSDLPLNPGATEERPISKCQHLRDPNGYTHRRSGGYCRGQP
jgi:hypothetical protein